MNPWRALIVDDEPLAREGIRVRLEPHQDIEVVGSVGRASDAVSEIRRLQPDVLFLDVQMPGMSGFQVLEALNPEERPLTVFVTAHDEHAVRAFEAQALDYLLKPVDDERFDTVLSRVRRRLQSERGPRYLVRFPVKTRGRIRFVEAGEIESVEAQGDYLQLHTEAGSHQVRDSLDELEQQLDPDQFVRIHRSTIVNWRRIVELQPYFHGEYVAILRSGRKLKVSRTYRDNLTRVIGRKL